MAWIFLIIGGLFEVGFTTCLNAAKHSTGAVATLWYAGFAVSLGLSMIFLMMAKHSEEACMPQEFLMAPQAYLETQINTLLYGLCQSGTAPAAPSPATPSENA